MRKGGRLPVPLGFDDKKSTNQVVWGGGIGGGGGGGGGGGEEWGVGGEIRLSLFLQKVVG